MQVPRRQPARPRPACRLMGRRDSLKYVTTRAEIATKQTDAWRWMDLMEWDVSGTRALQKEMIDAQRSHAEQLKWVSRSSGVKDPQP